MRLSWLIGTVALGLGCQVFCDEPKTKLQVVTPRPEGIMAAAINGRGDIIGFQWVENKRVPGVLEQVPFYAQGTKLTPLPLLDGYTATFPAALSDDGVVVGRAGKPAPLGVAVPLRNQAIVWDAKSGIHGLGVLEGDLSSFASDITADGRRISGYSVGDNRVRACIWERDGKGWKAKPLPRVSMLGSGVVTISDSGNHVAAVDGEKPCLWSELPSGQWKQEFIGGPGSLVPRAVNNSGMVVGLRFTLDGLTHAVIWSRGTGQKMLEKPQGYVRSEALSVNNQGIVVGMVDGPGGSKTGPNAFVYEAGRLRLVDEGGPFLGSATAINDRGQITGVFEKEEEPEKPTKPIEVKKKAR
jgi:uncharacterized membrane protein